jgi:hypothetical protein
VLQVVSQERHKENEEGRVTQPNAAFCVCCRFWANGLTNHSEVRNRCKLTTPRLH